MRALRRTTAPVRLVLDAKTAHGQVAKRVGADQDRRYRPTSSSRARTSTRRRDSPGINDDASGVAARAGNRCASWAVQPKVTNAVRFAFWGAQEAGLAVDEIRAAPRSRPAQRHRAVPGLRHASDRRTPATSPSTATSPASPIPTSRRKRACRVGGRRADAGRLPEPRRRAARRHAAGPGRRLQPVPVGGRPRSAASPPGSSQPKTAVQARLWGGQAGVAVRPELPDARRQRRQRQPRRARGDGSGRRVRGGFYAQTIGGVNGVPPQDQRHRGAP